MGEAFISALRDEVDALTVDYPVAQARAVVEDDNGLVYLNVWDQPATASAMTWFRSSHLSTGQFSVNTAGAPSTESLGPGEDRFGTSLVFDASQSQFVSFYDADQAVSTGFFVAIVVNFDALSLADGDTQVLLGKANAGRFFTRDAQSYGCHWHHLALRCLRRWCLSLRYVPSASSLDGSAAHFVIGAYDGNGAVRMWVDNDASGTTSDGPYTSGVVQNDVPVLLGADPQDGSERFFFSGKVQMALVQDWANH